MKGTRQKKWPIRLRIGLVVILALLPVVGQMEGATAAPLIVMNLTDSGPGSLREAIANASAGDTVSFAPGLQGEIDLFAQIDLTKDLTIAGPGTAPLTISGRGVVRVFEISASAEITITSLTIADGKTTAQGGAIHNKGNLTLSRVTLKNNLADKGGALFNSGSLTLSEVTISENTALNIGGGLYIDWTGKYLQTARLEQITISSNRGIGGGGGLGFTTGGLNNTLQLRGVLLAGNYIDSGLGADCFLDLGSLPVSLGYNLIGNNQSCAFSMQPSDLVGTSSSPLDPKLGPLSDNGGTSLTHALLPSSPAIDRGIISNCSPADQRGLTRPMDGDNDQVARCDIGAFEVINQLPQLGNFVSPQMDEAGVLPIGPDILEILDIDTSPDMIYYTLRTQPIHGAPHLLLTLPLSAGQVFTQTSIDNGSLTFNHDGSETFDAEFDFIATDQEKVPVRLISNGAYGPGNDHSVSPVLSANGRYLAFESNATNFSIRDQNNQTDVFAYDRQTGDLLIASVDYAGTPGNTFGAYNPAISADGRFIAFDSVSEFVSDDNNNASDVFVRNWFTGQEDTVIVSTDDLGEEGNGDSQEPAISADGRFVAFSSNATNLVSNDFNNAMDIFVHDLLYEKTQRVSLASDGIEGDGHSRGPLSISADGRYVAFQSEAANLVLGDSNGVPDVFVHDCLSGQTVRVSVHAGGGEADGASWGPALSADGRYVAFVSEATNLVDGDGNLSSDIFLHDLRNETSVRLSVASNGQEGNHNSAGASISANGQYVSFWSQATNLVSGDTNDTCDMDNDGYAQENCPDIFIVDHVNGKIRRVSMNANLEEANNASFSPSISADGRFIGYHSHASNLISSDANNYCGEDGQFGDNCSDIFVFNNHLIQKTFPISVNPTNDIPYVAIAQPQPVAYEGEPVFYTGSIYDPDPGDSHLINWDFGDGGTLSAITETQHIFQDDGNYLVEMTVVDLANATGIAQVNQEIKNLPPIVDAGEAILYLQVGSKLTRTGTVHDPGLDSLTGTVNYGDGSGALPLTIRLDGTFDLNFQYNFPGIYRTLAIVQDDDGGIGIDTVRVYVGIFSFLPLIEFSP